MDVRIDTKVVLYCNNGFGLVWPGQMMHSARQSNVSRLHNIHAESAIKKDWYATKRAVTISAIYAL